MFVLPTLPHGASLQTPFSASFPTPSPPLEIDTVSLYLAPSELEAEIPALLQRRAEEIQRQTALQRRRETNNRVRHDLSNYAEDNGLTFEQMCSEIALYRRTDDAYA